MNPPDNQNLSEYLGENSEASKTDLMENTIPTIAASSETSNPPQIITPHDW